jgi:hypothetical protein
MHSVSMGWRQVRSWCGVAAAVASLGCWDGKSIAPLPVPMFDSVVPRVALVEADAQSLGSFAADTSPVPALAETPTVTVWSAAVVGGSTRVEVSSTTPFDRVVIDGSNQAQGYWDIVLPAPVTSTSFVLSVGPAVLMTPVPARVAVGTNGGSLTQYASAPITVISVGTGEVQFSVSWDAQSDVDLHVTDPNGFRVFYGAPTSPQGGELDLDSNAACTIDGKRNENITWPFGTPPTGDYRVIVRLYAACGTARSRFVLTVRREGMPPEVFTGEVNDTTTQMEFGPFPYGTSVP